MGTSDENKNVGVIGPTNRNPGVLNRYPISILNKILYMMFKI